MTQAAGEVTVDVRRALLEGSMAVDSEMHDSQIHLAHELLHTLLDVAESAVFWKDTNSTYLGCNRSFASLAGRGVHEVIGRGDAEMPWASNADHHVGWDQRVLRENRTFSNVRESLVTHDGRELWLSTTRAPIRDGNGVVTGLVGILRDITAEVQAEDELHSTLTQLDQRVTERTNQLLRANETLRREVDERVRLQARERQLREHAEIRRDISASLAQTLDIDEVLDILLSGAQQLTPSDLVVVLLVEDTTISPVRIDASFDYQVDQCRLTDPWITRHPSIRVPGMAVEHQRTGTPLGFGPAQSSVAVDMVAGGALIGHLLLESRWSGFYSDDHVERLRGLAEQAAAVISNVRMTERAAELAAANERDRLRRDLHDSVVQTLAAAALVVDTEIVHMSADDPVRPAFERIQQLSAYANTEIRLLLNELTSDACERHLVDLLHDLASRTEWPFTVHVHGDAFEDPVGPSLDQATTTALYRITSEALTNARRHSSASAVEIAFSQGPPLSLQISDNGVGFDPLAVEGDHLGLTIMAERASEVGARLLVESDPKGGTTVRVVFDRRSSDQRSSDERSSDERDVLDRHQDALGGERTDTDDRSADLDRGGSVG